MAGSGANILNKALTKARVASYKAGQSQLDAIRSNLRTTGAGIGGALTSSQARTLSSIERVAATGQAKSTGALASATNQIRNRYGTAMGGITAPLLAPAAAHSKATILGAAGAVAGAVKSAQGGQLALGIEKAGARTARQGAEYQLNQALLYRAKQDAALVAQQKSDWLLYKQKADYANKLAAQAASAKDAGDLQKVLGEAPQFITALSTYMLNNPGVLPAAAVAQVMTDTGLGVGPNGNDGNAVAYFNAVANLIHTGSTPAEASQQAFDSSFSGSPGYTLVHTEALGAGVTTTISQTAAADLKGVVSSSANPQAALSAATEQQIRDKLPFGLSDQQVHELYLSGQASLTVIVQQEYDAMLAKGWTPDQIRAAAAINGMTISPDVVGGAVPSGAGGVTPPTPPGSPSTSTTGAYGAGYARTTTTPTT